MRKDRSKFTVINRYYISALRQRRTTILRQAQDCPECIEGQSLISGSIPGVAFIRCLRPSYKEPLAPLANHNANLRMCANLANIKFIRGIRTNSRISHYDE